MMHNLEDGIDINDYSVEMSFVNDELKEDPENYASIIKFIKKLHEYCTGK